MLRCFNAPPSEPDLRRKGGLGQIYDSPTLNAVSLPPRLGTEQTWEIACDTRGISASEVPSGQSIE
jgi:hypothetical protein